MNNLENKIFYRIIKVAYIIGLLFLFLIVFLVGQSSLPTKYIDNDLSYITCTNGKSFSLSTSHIYLFTKSMSNYDDVDARKVCAYEIVDDYLNDYKTPQTINYKLFIIESERGSLVSALMIWVFGALICFIVISIIKETLIYIFFGKGFEFAWLKLIIRVLKS